MTPRDDAEAELRFRDGSLLILPIRDAPHWPTELRVTVQPDGGFGREWSEVGRPRSLTAHVFHLAHVEGDRRALYDEVA